MKFSQTLIVFCILIHSTSSGSPPSLSVINDAVFETIFTKYGNDGEISKDSLTTLLKEVLASPNLEELFENDETDTSTLDTEDVSLSIHCGSVANISECQSFIEEKCLDASAVLALLTPGAPFNKTSFYNVFPVIFHYLQHRDCQVQANTHAHHAKTSSTQTWGYGIGFVCLICIVSNIGVCMGPCMNKPFFQRILMFCVALAVGTLGGTGFLVLIPESMGLTGSPSPVPDYAYKMATAIGGVYIFYVFERLLKIAFHIKKGKKKNVNGDTEHSLPLTQDILVNQGNDINRTVGDKHGHGHGHSHVQMGDAEQGGGVKAVAWMVLMGDALHNFMDGMAIGAAFTENTLAGITVSIAVICEELPHELGDIAILLHSGMSIKRALLLNFLAATTCFAGLAVGILVGENTNANVWIFGLAGGMFVYIALSDMIPEMGEQAKYVVEENIESPFMVFIIQNIGLMTGFGIIFTLATLGHNIEI